MKPYQKQIISTDEYATLLHRHTSNALAKIAVNGVICGPDVLSSSTLQPRDLGEAEQIYRNGGNNSNPDLPKNSKIL